MKDELSASILSERVRNFAYNQYQYIYGIMKGIALATATIVVLPAFWNYTDSFFPRLSFWFASFGAILVTHSTTARGILLANHKYNLFDSTLAIILGFFEFLLFVILQPFTEYPNLWHHWYLVFGIHVCIAGSLVTNRLAQVDVENDFAPSLQKLGITYREWLRSDRKGAFTTGVVFIIIWFFVVRLGLLSKQWGDTAHILSGVIAFVLMMRVVRVAESQRIEIAQFVFGNKEP